MVRFGQIWSDLVGFGRVLISSQLGRIWSDSVGFGQIWSDSVGFGRSSFWEGTLLWLAGRGEQAGAGRRVHVCSPRAKKRVAQD